MNAAVLRTLGRPPRFEPFPEPIAGEGEAIVRVRAASLKPVDKQLASGSHYASPRELPVVCGADGVGELENGERVFFGGPRRPYGAMAERTVVRRAQCFPVPAGLSDETAAAIPNPGVSAYLALKHRAKLAAGETVLILGATGVAGKLAVQIAKILGAGRVVAAGRSEQALSALPGLGADRTIRLGQPDRELIDAFRAEAGERGFDVILDYLWGRPTEALLAALARAEFAPAGAETRLVEVGQSAGPTIALHAALLRSAPVTILGTAGIPSMDALTEAYREVVNHAASGALRVDCERIPLDRIEAAWEREVHGVRLVAIP